MFAVLLTYYRLFLLLFFSAMFLFVWLMQFQKEIKIKWYAALILAIVSQILGVLGAFLLAQLEGLFGPGEPGVISMFGVVMTIPPLTILGAKLFHRDIRMMCDIYSLAIIIGMFFGRVNCCFAGCCGGIYIDFLGFNWPAREAELLFYIIIGFIMGRRCFKKTFDGRCMPIYLISYGVFRFFNEWLRETSIDFFTRHVAHFWCILFIIIGTVTLIIMNQKDKKAKNKPKAKKTKA